MDSKTNEKVLQKIKDIYKEPHISKVFAYEELEEVFGFPSNMVQAAFASLENLKLITVKFGPDRVVITTLPNTFNYFAEKHEKQIKHLKQWAWETIKWLIPLIVGYFLGKSS